MTQELMSLEEIEKVKLDYDCCLYPGVNQINDLLETARAAHELKAEVERLTKELEGRSFAKLMDREVDEELATARAEERERCAKLCEEQGSYKEPYRDGAKCCAEAIRSLKDAE
jgi:hypothetical protein